MDSAHAIDQIREVGLRADTAGTLQALAGLWQIFLRQGSLAAAEADQTLAALMTPFAKIQNDRELFDGGMAGVQILLKATHSPAKMHPQDRMIDLLAGTGAADSSDAHHADDPGHDPHLRGAAAGGAEHAVRSGGQPG